MKRYCLVNDKSSYSFQEKDLDFCYDINFKSLVDWVTPPELKEITDRIMQSMYINDPRKRMEFYLEQLPYYSEFRLDILNEVYLSLEYLEDDKTELLSEGDNDIQEFSEKIKAGIQSIKRWEEHCPNKILDIDTYLQQTEGKRMNLRKIPMFGSGVMKLWLASEEFRKVLNKNCAIKNCKADEIIKIIEKAEKSEESELSNLKITLSTDKKLSNKEEDNYKGVLKYSTTDAIILERILGLSELREFQDYVVPQLKGNENGVSDLLKSIRQYHGEYVRCFLIRLIGCCLYECGHKNRPYDENDILKEYKLKIDRHRDAYNEIYLTTHNQMLKKYGKNCSLQTTKKLVKKNIQWTKKMFWLSMPMTPLIKKLKEKTFKELMKQEEWDEIFKIMSGDQNRIPDFCFEYKKGSYERNKFKKLDLPYIEKSIIDASRLYYRWGEN